MSKTYTKCKEEKPIELFGKRADSNGYRSQCTACVSAKNLERYHTTYGKEMQKKRSFKALMKKYGISAEEYEKARVDQDYKCKLCSASEKEQYHNRLHIDHCHSTGLFRGLLCNNCNTGLGHFRDNIETLQKAIEYLNESSLRHRNQLEAQCDPLCCNEEH